MEEAEAGGPVEAEGVKDRAVGFETRREREGNIPGMRLPGGSGHFAAAVAAAAGPDTVAFPSPFCASGVGWGSHGVSLTALSADFLRGKKFAHGN
jgi:hypothetical protein